MKNVLYKGDIEGLSIDRASRNTVYNMIKHWHPEYEIQYYVAGKRHFFIKNHSYLVKPGSLVIVDSQQVHNTYSGNNIFHDRILLLLENETFAPIFQKTQFNLTKFFSDNWGVIQIPEPDRLYIENLLYEIYQETSKRPPYYHTRVASHLMELFVYIYRLKNNDLIDKIKPEETLSSNEQINEITSYIRENYSKVKRQEEIAKIFYLDKSYLCRMFKKHTGHTVMEFLNIQKIQHAQTLLEETTLSISEICEKVGYENTSYFNRVFKKYSETTPLQYRKKKSAYKKSLRNKNNF